MSDNFFKETKEDPGARPGPPDDVHRVENERQCSEPLHPEAVDPQAETVAHPHC